VLARRPELGPALRAGGRDLGLRLLREIVERWRAAIRGGELDAAGLDERLRGLAAELGRRVDAALAPSLVGVINATGVVVHTNLGRAVLPESARRAMEAAAAGYTNLELDLEAGRRGSRLTHLERPLAELFPGRAAIAVNNNAAALLLALQTLAQGREVVVSRGELVEIGGSFRIPEILERSGAVLREVGTTNRTRIADYREAIGERTAALLKVHPSNYRILGFTEEAALADLAALGRERGLPAVMDQGSGNLLDLSPWGIAEPPVAALLEQGADLVLFSGDKLLGGPQAGLAVGRADIVGAMRRNPLARALRLDKVTTAGLAATLGEYVRGAALETVPVLRMVAMTAEEIGRRAAPFADRLAASVGALAEVTVRDGGSVVGGGAWPLGTLPTRLVAVRAAAREGGDLERALRAGDPPVVARVEDGRLLLDLRTVLPPQEPALAAAMAAALGR
jgi:L-seryl-tRNA(Ser) seleniumtransferase